MLVSNSDLISVVSALLSIGLLGSVIFLGASKQLPDNSHFRFKSMLAFILTILGLWGLLLPLGLFGLSGYFITAFPLSGNQFTWLTINRYWVVGSLGILYIALLTIALVMRRFFHYWFQNLDQRLLQVLKRAWRASSLKDLLISYTLIFTQIALIAGLVGGLMLINALINQRLFFILSLGIINLLIPLIELDLLFKLLTFPVEESIKRLKFSLRSALGVGSLLLITLMSISWYPGSTTPSQQTIIVHRGVINGNSIPNTIGSLKKNSRYHFPYIEMDVQETKDHHFICAHDDTIKTLHHRRQEIDHLKLATIKKFHRTELFGKYLKLANRFKQPLIVELKVTNDSDKEMGTRFANQFGKQLLKQPSMVHSVGYNFLRQIKTRFPKIRIGLVTMLNFSRIANYRVDFYTLQHTTLTPFLLRSIQPKRPVYAWTDDHIWSMKQLSLMGVDGQVTDRAFALKKLQFLPQRNNWLLLLNLLTTYL